MTIEVFPTRNWIGKRRWFFTIKAKNGEPIAQSEAYQNRADCMATAMSLRAGLFDAKVVSL